MLEYPLCPEGLDLFAEYTDLSMFLTDYNVLRTSLGIIGILLCLPCCKSLKRKEVINSSGVSGYTGRKKPLATARDERYTGSETGDKGSVLDGEAFDPNGKDQDLTSRETDPDSFKEDSGKEADHQGEIPAFLPGRMVPADEKDCRNHPLWKWSQGGCSRKNFLDFCLEGSTAGFSERQMVSLLQKPGESCQLSWIRLQHTSRLNLSGNKLEGVAALGGLLSLTSLKLSQNLIRDLSPLHQLTNLRELYLDENRLDSLSGLEHLRYLRVLYISYNRSLNSLYPLKPLHNLRVLHASSTTSQDAFILAYLNNLESLNMSENLMADLAPLSGLASLSRLYLDANQIVSVSPLKNLKQLDRLSLRDNDIPDLSPLAGLWRISWLNISGNQLTDIEFLRQSDQLKSIILSNNQVTDLGPLVSHSFLEEIIADYNPIVDVDHLAKLKQLRSLSIQHCQVKYFDPLTNCFGLEYIDIRGCRGKIHAAALFPGRDYLMTIRQ